MVSFFVQVLLFVVLNFVLNSILLLFPSTLMNEFYRNNNCIIAILVTINSVVQVIQLLNSLIPAVKSTNISQFLPHNTVCSHKGLF